MHSGLVPVMRSAVRSMTAVTPGSTFNDEIHQASRAASDWFFCDSQLEHDQKVIIAVTAGKFSQLHLDKPSMLGTDNFYVRASSKLFCACPQSNNLCIKISSWLAKFELRSVVDRIFCFIKMIYSGKDCYQV